MLAATEKSVEASVESAKANTAVANYTFAMILVGALQLIMFAGQLYYVRRSIRQANESLIAAKQSADAATRTSETMEQTATRQLRAYVGYDGGDMNIADPSKPPFVLLGIKNFGLTPAYDVVHIADMEIAYLPSDRTLTPELPALPHFTLPPSAVMHPQSTATKRLDLTDRDTQFTRALLPQELQDLNLGLMAIYIYGEVTYRDAFEQPHRTRYRLMHQGIAGAPIGTNTKLAYCAGGNDAD